MRTFGTRAIFGALSLLAFFAVCLSSAAQSTTPNEWAWMGGNAASPIRPGVYGTLGSPAAANMPGSRNGVASWTDKNGNLWLFGGAGIDSAGNGGSLNDLWEFDSSTREWAWMSGSSVLSSWSCGGQWCDGQSGVYGTLGIPAAGNVPGGRAFAASWTDSNGNLWLFGGYGAVSTGKSGYFNDLWEYSPSAQEWTWMGGSSTGPTAGGPAGVYGTLDKPSSANVPGARSQAVSWTGKDGNLWLFGGYGFDSVGNLNPLNDLWEFNPSTHQWTWMGGSSTADSQKGRPGTYGTLGIPAAGNYPGSRYQANGWTDQNGNLWLFGGMGTDSAGNFSILNDLWEFNPITQEWAWITGSKVIHCASKSCGEPATYGSLGVPGTRNSPGGRAGATASTDSDGNFWLFGGWGNDRSISNNGYLNDLWVFSPSTQQWTWRSGSNSLGQGSAPQPGVYGTLGTPALSNVPGGREWAASWIDNSGNYWLFGGFGANSAGAMQNLDDLWEVNAAPTTFNVPAGTHSAPQLSAAASASPAAGAALPAIIQSTFTVPQCYTSCVLTLPSHPVGGMSCIFANTSGVLAPTGISNTAGFNWSPWIGSTAIGEDTVWASCAPTVTTASSDTVTVSYPATDYINGILWADVSNVTEIDSSVAVGELAWGTPTVSMPVTGSNDMVIAIVFIIDGTVATSGPGYSLFPTLGTGGADSTWSTDTWVEYKVITGSPAVVTASNAVAGFYITAVALKSLSTGTPAAANVTFSPAGGSYTSAQNVTLSTSAGSVICYNTTGNPATNGATGCTAGTHYAGPVSVSSSETLYAVAGGTGYTDSSVTTAAYTINVTGTKTTPTVTVSPSSSSITTAQALTVTVVVNATSGNPTPTGSVKLTSGTYTSVTATLSAGAATFNVPAGSLATGTDTLTVSYTPDAASSSIYNSASGSNSVTVTATAKTTPKVTVTPSSSSITTAQALTVTVAVAGTPTPTGSVKLTSGTYSSGAVTLSAGAATINVPAGSLATGTDTLTVSYTPDAASSSIYNNSSGTSSVTVTSTAKTTPKVTVTPSSSSIKRAQALTVTVAVAGTPTPTGSVKLTSGTYSSGAVTLSSGAATIKVPAGSLAIGTDKLTVTYTPGTASSSIYNSASGTNTVTVTRR